MEGTPAYTLRYEALPPLLNSERSGNRFRRAEWTSEWRSVFAGLARAQRIPRLDVVDIAVIHERKDGRSMPDCGAAIPATKASIDGLCDAGVLVNDSPEYVRSLLFRAPIVTGIHALVLELYPINNVRSAA